MPGNSCTAPKRHRRRTHQRTSRTEGVAQTCRALLDCRTGHRGLKSTTEEFGGSELSTGSASLCKVKHCGIHFSLRPQSGRTPTNHSCQLLFCLAPRLADNPPKEVLHREQLAVLADGGERDCSTAFRFANHVSEEICSPPLEALHTDITRFIIIIQPLTPCVLQQCRLPCSATSSGHLLPGHPCPGFLLTPQRLLSFTSKLSSPPFVAPMYLRRITCSIQQSPNGRL